MCDFGLRGPALLAAAIARTAVVAAASGQLPPAAAPAPAPAPPVAVAAATAQLDSALLARSLPWTAPEVVRCPREVTEKVGARVSVCRVCVCVPRVYVCASAHAQALAHALSSAF